MINRPSHTCLRINDLRNEYDAWRILTTFIFTSPTSKIHENCFKIFMDMFDKITWINKSNDNVFFDLGLLEYKYI